MRSLPTSPLTRRQAIAALGGAGAGATLLSLGAGHALAATTTSCVTLTPEVTAGPYYIANHLTRRNVTDGQKGIALQLRLTVADVVRCQPIPAADVEIWHANALGVYSGYGSAATPSPGAGGGGHVTPNNTLRFLRGHQRTDRDGLAIFDTIYPGWYRGRAPHIHVRVHVGGNVLHTGQLFFDDTLSDAVYRTPDYATHGQPDTTDSADQIYAQEGGARAVLRIRSHAGGYSGAITMGVKR